jgi:hypothetical protein
VDQVGFHLRPVLADAAISPIPFPAVYRRTRVFGTTGWIQAARISRESLAWTTGRG